MLCTNVNGLSLEVSRKGRWGEWGEWVVGAGMTDGSVLQPYARLTTRCEGGRGLAASPALGVLVTFSTDTLHVWESPTVARCSEGAGLTLVRSLPMSRLMGSREEDVRHVARPSWPGFAGSLAFTQGDHRPLLLAVDDHRGLVHIVDVVDGVHKGFLGPRCVTRPNAVAATKGAVVVSGTKHAGAPSFFEVFEGQGHTWTRLLAREVDAVHRQPRVLFVDWTPTLKRVCLIVEGSACIVYSGSPQTLQGVREDVMATSKIGQMEAGVFWDLLPAGRPKALPTAFIAVTRGPRALWVYTDTVDAHKCSFLFPGSPTALVVVPEVGVVSLETATGAAGEGEGSVGGVLRVFGRRDDVAMAAMSAARVAWMACAARAMRSRHAD